MFHAFDYGGLCRKVSDCQNYLRSPEKESLCPEVSFALRDGGDQNQARHTEKNLKDRYLLDPAMNRNSQLLLIKSLPFQSQGNRSHGNNGKEVSTSAVNLVLSWARRRISLCICSANRLHPTERFWPFPAPPKVPWRLLLPPRPWSVPSRARGSGDPAREGGNWDKRLLSPSRYQTVVTQGWKSDAAPVYQSAALVSCVAQGLKALG